MNIVRTSRIQAQAASHSQTSQPKAADSMPPNGDSFTFSEGSEGRPMLLKLAQGAAIGYVNHNLGGGAWKSGFVGGAIRAGSFYIEARMAARDAVKNGDVPGGLGVGTVMGRMGATVGFVSGFPTFAVAAACANLAGGGPIAHAVSGAIANAMTS